MAATNPFTWLGLLLTYATVPLSRIIFTQIFGEPLDETPFIFREILRCSLVCCRKVARFSKTQNRSGNHKTSNRNRDGSDPKQA